MPPAKITDFACKTISAKLTAGLSIKNLRQLFHDGSIFYIKTILGVFFLHNLFTIDCISNWKYLYFFLNREKV